MRVIREVPWVDRRELDRIMAVDDSSWRSGPEKLPTEKRLAEPTLAPSVFHEFSLRSEVLAAEEPPTLLGLLHRRSSRLGRSVASGRTESASDPFGLVESSPCICLPQTKYNRFSIFPVGRSPYCASVE